MLGRAVAVTPESQSARYFASLYAAPRERPALDALFGIEREVFDSVREGLDHHVSHTRLQWWREESERATRGGAAHPLVRTLIAALGDPHAKSLPQLAGLAGIVDVATWDLASATFETRRELEAYCQRWAAAMIEPLVAAGMAATASPTPGAAAASAASSRPGASTGSAASPTPGAAAPGGADASAALLASAQRSAGWHALGVAICEIELLAGLARDAHSGRIRLPLNELESANVDTSALAKQPWPETAAALIRSRLTSLRNDIERNVASSTREEQQALRGLLVWAALSWRAAQRMESALPNRLQPSRLDGISEAWFAWRMARRATVGRFKLP